MTYQEFVSGPEAQQRYWARSHLGWGRMKRAEPNPGHLALARLDPELLITQNVDGLHEQAGSRRLVALHGRIADVVCLGCRATSPRGGAAGAAGRAQPRATPSGTPTVLTRPDGDVELEDTADFVVPGLRRVRRGAEAGRGVLRRERPRRPGGAVLRGGGRAVRRSTGRCWWRGRRWR